jgi:hypothetical protein
MNRIQLQTDKQWDNEPEFVDVEGNGYHLVVLRSHMGNLNGYVGVNRQHPWFGKHYDDRSLWGIQVHGGLTFCGKAFRQGMKGKYWYFGFDTAHAFDLVPELEAIKKRHDIPSFDDLFGMFEQKIAYRDINYVSKEVNDLFLQLKEVKDKNPNYKFNHKREYKRLGKIKKKKKEHMDFFKGFKG